MSQAKLYVWRLNADRRRYWTLPRCEAEVEPPTARWREHAGRDTRCDMRALYAVGEHTDSAAKLCERHAGRLLLKRLVRNQ